MIYRGPALANLTTSVVTGVASVGMASVGLGVWSLSLSGLIAALVTNVLLYRLTPLRLRLRFDKEVARRHAGFGFNITALDLISHVRAESINLIMSKLAGPAFLGLFNKADSLARMPNRVITPATGKVVFRALSEVADDLAQSKYILYRTITLLSVYIFPFLVGMAWLAEPLIVFLYGEKWLPAAEPTRIIAVGSFLLTSLRPCAVLLEAQNRLRQEMIAVAISAVFAAVGCYVGLRWGLSGVAWSMVLTHLLTLVLIFRFVCQTIPTGISDLGRALKPALILNSLLVAVLVGLHILIAPLRSSFPSLYLLAMAVVGGGVYASCFLLLPIQALETEAARWRGKIAALPGRLRLRR
jgi:O-antigen/teichoic acid export membrane protein